MERYNEYKDSGVQWLGEIPSHWTIMPLKYSGRFCKGKLPSNTNDNCLGKPIIGASEMNGNMPSVYSEDNSVPQCTQNDILFLWDGANAGLVSSFHDGIVASTVTKFTCDNSNIVSTYLYYLEKNYQRYYKERVGGTTIPHMNSQYIASCPLLIPSIQEQQAIADYLDTATTKIDEAIAQQQKMIDLLNERKQIIINNAVTKGLNPDAPMKDSGVEWIGVIPEHWEITKLKKKSKIILGKMLSNAPGNKYEYFCAKDVHYGCADDSDLKQMFFSDTEREQYKVNYGDMLIVEGGAGAGGCAIYKGTKTAYIQNSIMIVRGNEDMVNEYICSFMQSINQRGYVEFICNKATIPHFTKEKAGGVNIAVPPIEEQNKIVKYIEKMCAPIDNAISSAAKQISLLQERKQIIINDVVTGKVKVS